MTAAEAVPVGEGRFTAPQNRWDLIPDAGAMGSVSVIVPFFDQQAQLERLLVGIELQRCPYPVVEVIVGDDGSARTPTIPDWYAGPPVRVVRQEDRGVRPAAVRNLAAAQAEGDVLAFLDADMVPSPTYLAAAAALPLAAPEALVVGTRQHWDLARWGPEPVRSWLQGGVAPPRLADPAWLADGYRSSGHLVDLDGRAYQWVIGAVLTVARPIFDEVGGYDATIVGYGAEDWELAHRIQQAGGLLAHVDAVAHHDGPDWRGRAGADGTKNHERQNLVARIPGLDDPVTGPVSYVAASIDARGAAVEEIVACVASVLAAGGTAIAIEVRGVDGGPPPLLAHDPRVHWGEFCRPSAVGAVQRWQLTAPVTFRAGAFRRLVASLAPGGPGRVVVGDPVAPLVVGVEQRCRRRVERWFGATSNEVGWDQLFGPPTLCDAGEVGVALVGSPVDLAEVFPR